MVDNAPAAVFKARVELALAACARAFASLAALIAF